MVGRPSGRPVTGTSHANPIVSLVNGLKRDPFPPHIPGMTRMPLGGRAGYVSWEVING